jgi:hypothetical protein
LPDGTCNPGLSCLSGLCVQAGAEIDASAVDAAPDASGSVGDAASEADATAHGDSAATCVPNLACTPANAAPCAVYGTDCSTGTALCVHVGNVPAGHSCNSTDVCNAAGQCVACQAGASCVPPSAPCYEGSLDCTTGACVASAVALANGSACGSGAVCDLGVCAACAANQPCTPSQGVCVQGRTDCSTGALSCVAIGPVPDGTPCGGNNVCTGGSCVPCVSAGSCTPANPCHSGVLGCGSNSSTCTDTGSLPDNVFCGVGALCSAGACTSAGPWITRGEDNRTYTGGYVFTFANNGATVAPLTSTTIAFSPSAGGRSGNDLEVHGVDPVPISDVSALGALAWTFTATQTAYDGAARGSGIDLWLRSAYTGPIQIWVADIWTDPTFSRCSASTDATVVDRCYDYPEYDCVITNPGVWTECSIPWSSFVRPNWGNLGAGIEVDSTQISMIQINVPATTISSLSSVSYDIAVDDVRFLP